MKKNTLVSLVALAVSIVSLNASAGGYGDNDPVVRKARLTLKELDDAGARLEGMIARLELDGLRFKRQLKTINRKNELLEMRQNLMSFERTLRGELKVEDETTSQVYENSGPAGLETLVKVDLERSTSEPKCRFLDSIRGQYFERFRAQYELFSRDHALTRQARQRLDFIVDHVPELFNKFAAYCTGHNGDANDFELQMQAFNARRAALGEIIADSVDALELLNASDVTPNDATIAADARMKELIDGERQFRYVTIPKTDGGSITEAR